MWQEVSDIFRFVTLYVFIIFNSQRSFFNSYVLLFQERILFPCCFHHSSSSRKDHFDTLFFSPGLHLVMQHTCTEIGRTFSPLPSEDEIVSSTLTFKIHIEPRFFGDNSHLTPQTMIPMSSPHSIVEKYNMELDIRLTDAS